MTFSPRRGQLHWVDFNPVRGSEQGGRRPAVVVSNDIANRNSPVVTVVPITSKVYSKQYPQNVPLAAGVLQREGTALCAQVRTVARDRLTSYIGDLTPDELDQVNEALRVALGLPKQ